MKSKSAEKKITNAAAWGSEPKWDNTPVDPKGKIATSDFDQQVSFALNWYSQNSKHSDQKKWVLEYLTKNHPEIKPDLLTVIGQMKDAEFYPTGSLCRMVMRGAKMNPKMMGRIRVKIDELVQVGIKTKRGITKKAAKAAAPKCEHQPAHECKRDPKICDAIGRVIETMEKLCYAAKPNITASDLAWSNGLTNSQIKVVKEKFQHELDEWKLALAGTDKDIKEAYATYDKPRKKRVIEFLTVVMSTKSVVQSVGRKPRKKKTPSVEKLVKKVLFMPKDPETGTQSVSAEEIIGAKELWIYNAKNRKLGVYYATNPMEGLSVKGTTVLAYNTSTSVTKNLRKPKEQLAEFMGSGRVAMKKVFADIRSVAQSIAPRLGRETILLKAVKA